MPVNDGRRRPLAMIKYVPARPATMPATLGANIRSRRKKKARMLRKTGSVAMIKAESDAVVRWMPA